MFCKNCWANLPDETEQCGKCGLDPRVRQESIAKDSEDSEPPPAWLGNSSVPDTSASSQKPSRCPIKNVTLAGEPSRKDPLVRIIFTVALFIVIGGAVYHYYNTSRELKASKADSRAGVVSDKAPEDQLIRVGELASPRLVLDGNGASLESIVEGVREAEDFAAGVEAFKAESYRDAAFYFKEVYKTLSSEDESFDTIQINIARSLTALGWESFGERRYQSAKEFFEEAGEYYMEASSLKGLAYSQASLEDYDGAIDSLDLLLRDFGPDLDAKMTLKLVYIKQAERMLLGGRTDESVGLMEQASELDPQDEAVADRLLEIKEESGNEEGFGERRGSRFNVKFEGAENAVSAHVIAILLEEAYQTIGAKLSYYPDTPINAVLYSGESFRDVTRSPSWAGALYDGRIKIPAGGITEQTNELEAVLFHEYTHALVHRLSKGRAPTWLNEGLAQYLEEKREADYEGLLRALAKDGGPRLSRLEGSFMGLDSRSAAMAYGVSLSATEYIIREYGISACKRILEGVGSGKSLAAAIDDVLFISYEEFQDGWQRYLNRHFGS